jgi:hypothetical protein
VNEKLFLSSPFLHSDCVPALLLLVLQGTAAFSVKFSLNFQLLTLSSLSLSLQAEVVAATLSSAGGELMQLMPRAHDNNGSGTRAHLGFDAIICDEAAQVMQIRVAGLTQSLMNTFHKSQCKRWPHLLSLQALEPSTLIALQLLAPGGRLVLVGDPQQLPATVVSRAASAAALAQSLFERLMQVQWLSDMH